MLPPSMRPNRLLCSSRDTDSIKPCHARSRKRIRPRRWCCNSRRRATPPALKDCYSSARGWISEGCPIGLRMCLHSERSEQLLLQKVRIGQTGSPLDQDGKQIIASIAVGVPHARLKVQPALFHHEFHDVVVACRSLSAAKF